MLDVTNQPIIPFWKWAGGKRWLASEYSHLLPKTFDRYFEPFLGGAAIFFHLQPRCAILSDSNPQLVNVYVQIKKDWKRVYRALKKHGRSHNNAYYYLERDRNRYADHELAARFLYLNRTCWNGLYRVNLQGKFNVPIGTKDAVLLDTDDFERSAAALKHAKIVTSDFEPVIAKASRGDFVFVDPPYVTRHNTNGFLKYNQKIFSWADQKRLAASIKGAASRGAKILLTNADHTSIKQLYASFGKRVILKRHSILAADSINRGVTSEIAIAVNYDVGGR